MNLQLSLATDSDRPIIRNLVHYYIYDMSEYMGWDCDAEGRWDGCSELPDYWVRQDHHPYVIRVDGSVAGFALV